MLSAKGLFHKKSCLGIPRQLFVLLRQLACIRLPVLGLAKMMVPMAATARMAVMVTSAAAADSCGPIQVQKVDFFYRIPGG